MMPLSVCTPVPFFVTETTPVLAPPRKVPPLRITPANVAVPLLLPTDRLTVWLWELPIVPEPVSLSMTMPPVRMSNEAPEAMSSDITPVLVFQSLPLLAKAPAATLIWPVKFLMLVPFQKSM